MIKWAVYSTLIGFGLLAFSSFLVGLHVQRWAAFWFGTQGPIMVTTSGEALDIGSLPLAPVLGPRPIVSDAERYQLALAAGFSPDEAITATAISIAENGGGDPTALSGANRDGSRDFGLLQINSGWWPRFGGQQALADPLANFKAGHWIYANTTGWCAWSTYDARCGPGHNGAYSSFLPRARAAALP